MPNKQIDININDNVAKWMQDATKWRPCQRKSYTVYVIQPPVGFVVANKLEQLTGYDFIKKEFQQAGGTKRGIPFLDLRNNPERLEKVREGIKSGKLELTVVEEGRVLLCGTLGEVWTASADVVRSSYTLSDGKPVGEISKTEWMPIVRKGESAPSAKGMLLPVKYRGILETKYGTRIMNDPRVSGHNAGDILVATTKKDGSLGLSTINNTVFANTFNLIVGGWSANKLVVPSQNSAQGSLLEQLNNMMITQACAKKVVPYSVEQILAMHGGDGGSSDTFQHLSQKQVDLLYKKFTLDDGMSKDDAFGEIYSIDCNLDNEDDEDDEDDTEEEDKNKKYTGWQPTSVTFDEDGDVVVAKDDCIKVSLVNLGEGLSGDYDENDPEDVNLLRFDVYYRNPEEGLDDWEPVDDASYCTNVEANSTKEHLEKVVRALFKRYRDEYRNIATGGSVKKMGEELSHIS